MKLVDIGVITKFASEHADVRTALEVWIAEAREATWESPADIKIHYVSASFLSNNRVVFNIKGNRYRLLVQISYKLEIVYILRIGTHAEYDRWEL